MAENAFALPIIDTPVPVPTKAPKVPVAAENMSLALAMPRMNGVMEAVDALDTLINTPVPEQMRPAALEHRATETTMNAIAQQVIAGMAELVPPLTLIHATDLSNE